MSAIMLPDESVVRHEGVTLGLIVATTSTCSLKPFRVSGRSTSGQREPTWEYVWASTEPPRWPGSGDTPTTLNRSAGREPRDAPATVALALVSSARGIPSD